MIRFAVDGILSFSLVPLRLATWMGFAAAGLSLLGILYALVLRLLTDIWVPGWTLLFIALLFVERRPARVPGRHRRVHRPDLRRESSAARSTSCRSVSASRASRAARAARVRVDPVSPEPAPLAAADRRPGGHRRLRPAAGAPAAGRRRAGGDGTDVAWRGWPSALAALACGYTLRIVRWWMMLRAMDPAVRLGECVRPFLVSIAVNNLLPFRAGDAVPRASASATSCRRRRCGSSAPCWSSGCSTSRRCWSSSSSACRGRRPAGCRRPSSPLRAWMAAAGAALVLTLLLLASRLEAISEAIGCWPMVRRHATLSWIAGQVHHVAGVLGVLHTPSMTARLALLSWSRRGCSKGWCSSRSRWASRSRAGRAGRWFALATGTLATLIPELARLRRHVRLLRRARPARLRRAARHRPWRSPSSCTCCCGCR